MLRIVSALIALAGLLAAVPAAAADCQDYAGGMQWIARLEFGFGGDSDLAFDGNTAYVAMNKVKLVNVGDPTAPYQYGELSAGYANPRRVDAADGLLVASIYSYGIEIYDLDQPGIPPLLVRYQTPTPALDVCLYEGYCYVGCEDIGVLRLDLSDPADPVSLGGLGGGDARRVAEQDGHLYTALDGQLVVYDLAVPTNPQETYRWGNQVIDAVPAGPRLYVARALSGFAVFELNNPSFPASVGLQDTESFTQSAIGFGDYVFPIYSSWSQIECYLAPAAPPWSLVDSIDTAFGIRVLKFRGDFAFGTGSESLEVFDLRQPEGGAELLGFHEDLVHEHMFAVAAQGGFAYVSNDGDQLGEKLVQVIDVRDPAAPQLRRSLSYFDSAPVDFALGDSLLYVADLVGVDIVDIAVPPEAERLTRVDTHGSANQVTVAGTWLYIADGPVGLVVASLEPDPAAPAFVSELAFSDDAIAVTVAGNLALCILADGTLVVVDVSDPAAPSLLGTAGGFLFADDVSVGGNTAYVDGGGTVSVVSLSDPTDPQVLATLPVPGNVRDLAVAGSTLYLAAGTAGLQAVDVTDPAAPLLLGGLDLVHISEGIDIAKGVVHVASRSRLNLAPLNCGSVTGAAAAPAAPDLVLGNAPNPFNPVTWIQFELPVAAPVRLDIHDATGRRVRRLLAGESLAAGVHRLAWRGRDQAGRALPSGVYLLRLEAGARRTVGKLTLLR